MPSTARTTGLKPALDPLAELSTIATCLRTNVLVFENNPVAELAVGRSTVRRRILALLIADPAARLHLREIQRRAGTSPGTASRELTKLVSAGLIEREAEGNQVYFRGSASPFATMLRSLLLTAPTLPPNPGAPAAARVNGLPATRWPD